jgi:hypothetical protein
MDMAITVAVAEAGGYLVGRGLGWLFGQLSSPAIRFYPSVQSVLGNSYKSVSEVTVPVNNTGLLNALGPNAGSNWVKVYEAGILNGQKVETHYFRNLRSNEVFDVKIKYFKWNQKAFKSLP